MRLALFLALGSVVVAVSAVALVVGIEITGTARPDTEGTTDRVSYTLVRTGQTQAEVIDLLGSAPRAAEAAPLTSDPPRCYIYDRRSGRPGGYRFCFQHGLMVSKSRLAWPT